MAKRYSIHKILGGAQELGSSVEVCGWVRTRRDSKAGLSFIQIHDGSCFAGLQVIADSTLENYAEEIVKVTTGCSLRVTGVLKASEGKGQSLEINASDISVVGWVENPETYPMAPKRHSREYLREIAHLRPRTNLIGAVTRIRNCLAQATHRFFHEREFYWIHTPIITTNDCEGAGEMFRVSTLDMANPPRTEAGAVDYSQDFFGKETHLTVSGQLNVETYCLAMSNVYTFGPTFRAENSNTRRHLAEFWMIEPEIAFADLKDDAALAEAYLKYIFSAALEERMDDLEFFAKFVDKDCINRLQKLVESNFVHLDYTEAIDELQKTNEKFEFPVSWGMDLQAEHEKFLTDKLVDGPVAVLNYPKDIKAFYMRLNKDDKTVAAMDVLAPGIGEIIGGSQREDRLDVLDQRIRDFGLEPGDYGWYRDLRRYGSVPHAGFGLGFERAVMYATGLDNIRDVIPYPRAPNTAEF
ncbi:MAG: asparagine--tRNA ligase [Myxococcota bacterium]|nr:asparagine--tRNA ligase [Myxococcota bacterium]